MDVLSNFVMQIKYLFIKLNQSDSCAYQCINHFLKQSVFVVRSCLLYLGRRGYAGANRSFLGLAPLDDI